MKAILLDMVWPALYVSETFWRFWFLVIGTIIIETFVIKYFLKYSWSKSFIVSLIGNSVSGFIGTIVMMYAMLFWHLLVDNFLPHATFDRVNWVATYFLMCLGSVLLEILTVSLIFKEKIKRLFLPMLTGNLLSYLFIAYVMITASYRNQNEKPFEILKYLPSKRKFILLDSSWMKIDTTSIRIPYDKNNQKIADSEIGYELQIPFRKQDENSFQFNLRAPDDANNAGMGEKEKSFYFHELKDTYEILLEQKNPDTSFGWMKPIVTDTLIFKKISR